MIRILNYGQVSNDEIFGRVMNNVDVSGIVSQIIQNVRAGGDKAVLEYNERFDGAKMTVLEVTAEELDAALEQVEGEFLRILELAAPSFAKKRRELEHGWKLYRINHLSWWEQELPTKEEMEEGRRNLEANRNNVDFIVTHCCASSTQVLLGGSGLFEVDYLNEYLEEVRQRVKFKKWFFGHYHDNKNVNAEEILLYEQIIQIG